MRDTENIILDLNAMDFSDAVPNEHIGFEHETLYIFGKEVLLIERYGTAEKLVPLYIKFNKLHVLITAKKPHDRVTKSALAETRVPSFCV